MSESGLAGLNDLQDDGKSEPGFAGLNDFQDDGMVGIRESRVTVGQFFYLDWLEFVIMY